MYTANYCELFAYLKKKRNGPTSLRNRLSRATGPIVGQILQSLGEVCCMQCVDQDSPDWKEVPEETGIRLSKLAYWVNKNCESARQPELGF